MADTINGEQLRALIGARVLVGPAGGYGNAVEELELLEVSPAGSYVRVRNVHGTRRWMRTADVKLLERLLPLEPDPARVVRKDVAERVEALEGHMMQALGHIEELGRQVKELATLRGGGK